MSRYFMNRGFGNVGSYLAAGFPYITGSAALHSGSEDHIRFPMVTRSVTVISRANPDLRVHFDTATGTNVYSGMHYVTLTENKDSITMNIRIKDLYISNADAHSGSYQVFAELTGITATEVPDMSGSGINE